MVFFESKHSHLKNDYKHDDGIHTDACAVVAADMATCLRAEGHDPQLFAIRGAKIEGTYNRETLIPKPFEGRVRWGGHCICVLGGVVYDPMLEQPVPMDHYLEEAFGEPVDLEDITHVQNPPNTPTTS